MINYSGSTVLAKIFQLIKSKFDSLATVASTGSYNDLTDKPNIGTSVRATIAIESDNVSSINIPITVSDINNLTVYLNGLLLSPTTHYTATTSAITLVGYTVNKGDIFTFVNSVGETGTSLNASASQVLFSDTTSDNSYEDCVTVQDALIRASEFKSDIKKISVNGVEKTPDTEGSVNIAVPSVPVKSISLYGANVSADTNGNVNITGLVKSLSINGTSYSPNSTGVLTLTHIMKNNTNQTMTAKLVAQNNTDYTTKQVRNIFLVPKSQSSNLPTGSSGDICIIYKDS